MLPALGLGVTCGRGANELPGRDVSAGNCKLSCCGSGCGSRARTFGIVFAIVLDSELDRVSVGETVGVANAPRFRRRALRISYT